MAMGSVVLGLEDVSGPRSEIIDEPQILLAGLGYGPIASREHAQMYPDEAREDDS